jgi:hypothetical protein
MSTRQSLILGAATVIGCLTLGLFFGQPSAAVPVGKVPAQAEVGRYQFAPQGNNFYLVDTSNGRIWYAQEEANKQQQTVFRWVEMVPPLGPKAKK